MLVGSYFCTYISYLLDFDIDNMVSFDTKYFFVKVNFNLPNTLKEGIAFLHKILITMRMLLSYIWGKCMLSSSPFINLPNPLLENSLWFVNNGFNKAKKTYRNHAFFLTIYRFPYLLLS